MLILHGQTGILSLNKLQKLKDAPGDRGHRADLADRANSFKREL